VVETAGAADAAECVEPAGDAGAREEEEEGRGSTFARGGRALFLEGGCFVVVLVDAGSGVVRDEAEEAEEAEVEALTPRIPPPRVFDAVKEGAELVVWMVEDAAECKEEAEESEEAEEDDDEEDDELKEEDGLDVPFFIDQNCFRKNTLVGLQGGGGGGRWGKMIQLTN
jgi:hypothetical protein